MDTWDIPLWVKILGAFLAMAAVVLVSAWDIIFAWISDAMKNRQNNRRKL